MMRTTTPQGVDKVLSLNKPLTLTGLLLILALTFLVYKKGWEIHVVHNESVHVGPPAGQAGTESDPPRQPDSPTLPGTPAAHPPPVRTLPPAKAAPPANVAGASRPAVTQYPSETVTVAAAPRLPLPDPTVDQLASEQAYA